MMNRQEESGSAKRRRKPQAIKARVIAVLDKAGDTGMHYDDLKDAVGASVRQSVNTTVKRLVADGLIQRRSIRRLIMLWPPETSTQDIEAVWAREVLKEVARRREMLRRIARDASERARRKQGARRMEDVRRQAEARAAIRKEKADARKLAADLAALDLRESESAKRKAKTASKNETQHINRLAAKFKGTVSPTAIVPKPAKPEPVEIPRHLVTVCKPMTLPHERIQPAGVIAKEIGRYSVEASSWAQAVAA